MKNDYIVKTVYRSFVVVSILTALTATAGMLIDNIIVGRFLGAEALGAMGVVGPVSLIFSAFGNICSGGGTARASQAIGRGDREQVNRIFTATVLFVLLSGAALTAAGLLFTPRIADLLGARGALKEPAEQYLYGFFLGAIPTIMMTAMMGFVRIDGSPRLPLVCMGVMTGANIILDVLMALVFRKGMFGMALATTISYCLAVLAACTHFAGKHNTLRLVPPRALGRELAAMTATGAPTAISRVCDTLKVALLNNLLVTAAGAGAVTALNVRTQAANILGALVVGIGQATIPVVGMFFGEQDRTALKDALKATLTLGLAINCAMAAVLLLFPSLFPSLLGVTDPETMAMATSAIRLFALGMPISLLNTVMMNFYQSTRRSGLATAICVLQVLAYTALFSFLLIGPMGSDGVWLAFLIGEVMTFLTINAYVALKNRRFSPSLSAFMLLDEGFGGDPRDRLELSIGNSMEEVMTISSGIHKFGNNRNIGQKALGRLSLLIEEMAGNVVKHAFKPGEKKWLDLMILDREDSLVIRMRDNGAPFDPAAYLKEAGAEEHLGIRLVSALSDRFEYRHSMGLNVLIMELNKGGAE